MRSFVFYSLCLSTSTLTPPHSTALLLPACGPSTCAHLTLRAYPRTYSHRLLMHHMAKPGHVATGDAASRLLLAGPCHDTCTQPRGSLGGITLVLILTFDTHHQPDTANHVGASPLHKSELASKQWFVLPLDPFFYSPAVTAPALSMCDFIQFITAGRALEGCRRPVSSMACEHESSVTCSLVQNCSCSCSAAPSAACT